MYDLIKTFALLLSTVLGLFGQLQALDDLTKTFKGPENQYINMQNFIATTRNELTFKFNDFSLSSRVAYS